MFNLTQSLSEPTHNQDHQLDSVFSKQIVPGDQLDGHHSTHHHSSLTSDQPGGHHPNFTTHPSPVTNLAVTTPLLTTHPSSVTNLAVTTPLLTTHQ